MRVYNGRSGSDESEKVTCKTQDEGMLLMNKCCKTLHISTNYFYYVFCFPAPQKVPDLIVTPLSPISIHVEWSAINVNLAGGVVTLYQLIWRRLHSSSNYIQLLHNNVRQYTITGNSSFVFYLKFKMELHPLFKKNLLKKLKESKLEFCYNFYHSQIHKSDKKYNKLTKNV